MRKGRYVNEINLSRNDRSYLSLRELQLLMSRLLLYFTLRCQQQDKGRQGKGGLSEIF